MEIAAILGAVLILWLIARSVRALVQRTMSRRRIQPEVVRLVSRATFIAIIVLGIVIGASYALGQGQLGASGVLAATILAALGIQDILRNYVSGVYILSERRLNTGDEIEVGGRIGTIVEIRFRVTYVRGRDGELIIVPNSELFNSTVTILKTRTADPSVPQPEGTDGPTRKRRA